MVEVTLTVGKLDASLALLLTKDHHLIEFPTILLPDGISQGSIVKLVCERDLQQEEIEDKNFERLQEEIFNTFGKNGPKAPVLKTLNITQTSCVLEWEPLELGIAEVKSLTLFKNGKKLGLIKNPMNKKTIKLSGLPVDTPYTFQLRLDTTSGVYFSNLVELTTHKMTDLSGINICLGQIDYSLEEFGPEDLEEVIREIGAKPVSSIVKTETTQFVCTQSGGAEYDKAVAMNIPIIRPEWLKACEQEKRIVGVNKFYLSSEPAIWKQRKFWKKKETPRVAEAEPKAEFESQSVAAPESESATEPVEESKEIEHKSEEPLPPIPAQSEDEKLEEVSLAKEDDVQTVPKINIISTDADDVENEPVEKEITQEVVDDSSVAPVVETEPEVEEPAAENPVVEETTAEEPAVEETTAEEPAVEEPATEEPVVEEPSTEEPAATEELTAVEEPVVEEPVIEVPVAEQPIAEETVTEKPAEEPAPEEAEEVEENEENEETEETEEPEAEGQTIESSDKVSKPANKKKNKKKKGKK
ncbi:unnamed protein product [[Candida] boidinii]|uniref:Unnamed protein product n=1 Tax=Candida boidinii TaxID=5477 RepID=A0A9W6WGM0_CANBO|nr:hypothetical protein B5S30_g5621 [[Candida] boidinii]GME68483.1 unnamed protein product [[Candida] boidinii]